VKRAVWSCHHAQNEHALEAFKKGALLPALAKVRASLPAGHADRDLVPERSPRRP
jgi:hypothetical protein